MADDKMTLHDLINRAKRELDAINSEWLRVRVSDFVPLDGGAHRRMLVHPVALMMGRSESQIAPQWEGRVWRKDAERLEAFMQAAARDGTEFDALIRIDLNSRAGMVLVIESVRL